MPPEPNNIVNIYCVFSPRPLAPGGGAPGPLGPAPCELRPCRVEPLRLCCALWNNNGTKSYTAFIIITLCLPPAKLSSQSLVSPQAFSHHRHRTQDDRSPTTQLSATTSVSIGFNLSASSPACVAQPPIQPRFSPQSTVTHLVPAESSLSTAVRVTTCQLSLRWVDHLVQSCQMDSHQAHGSL